MIVAVSLTAACLLGLGFVAQQHAAYREPLNEILHVRLLTHLIRSPLWLLGIGLMIGGQLLGAVALSGADVARVAPLLATNLLFALAAAHVIYQEHLGRSEWLGAVLVSGGAALFLTAGRPYGGRAPEPGSAHWLVAALVIAVAAGLVLAGLRCSLQGKAVLLAAAAGTLYGLQDALTRGSLLDPPAGDGRTPAELAALRPAVRRRGRAAAHPERVRRRAAAGLPARPHRRRADRRDRPRRRDRTPCRAGRWWPPSPR